MAASEQGVDERRDRRPLRKDDQHAKQQQDNYDWRKPEFLALTHKIPQIFDQV
jgi:hypothetical protein